MELKEIIQSIYPLPQEEYSLLENITELVHFKKDKLVIKANKVSSFIYFQKEGICRIYYQKKEKEVILGFTFPAEVLMSLNSYIHKKVGYETIETLEDSSLYRIKIEELNQLFEKSVYIANWGRKLAEMEALKIEERLMLRAFKTSIESYNELNQKIPNITNRIKLGYIASYLGISQVTLSRIRAVKK